MIYFEWGGDRLNGFCRAHSARRGWPQVGGRSLPPSLLAILAKSTWLTPKKSKAELDLTSYIKTHFIRVKKGALLTPTRFNVLHKNELYSG